MDEGKHNKSGLIDGILIKRKLCNFIMTAFVNNGFRIYVDIMTRENLFYFSIFLDYFSATSLHLQIQNPDMKRAQLLVNINRQR